VQGHVPGQAVQPLDQVEEQVEVAGPQARGAQLGQLCDGEPDVAGPDVRERTWRSCPPRPAAGRARPRRPGRRGGSGRCPSSTRRSPARRPNVVRIAS
jgi:hypothetical protein